VTDGTPEFAVWTLERPSVEATAFTARRVAQSTAGLVGSIMASGDTILVSRSRPNDPRISDVSLIPFLGGAQRSLGSHRLLVDWDFEQEGRALLMAKVSGRQFELSRLDLATGQSVVLSSVPGDRGNIESVAGGGFVQRSSFNSVAVHGVPGRPDTVFTIPESSFILALEPSPDGREVAVASLDLLQRVLLRRLSLVDGTLTELARMGGEGFDAITWLPDNTLLFSIDETQWTKAWYRLPVSGGPPRRQDLQLNFDGSYRFARNGLRGVARERTLRSDIFLLRGLNVAAPR
jgi:hypothetical protein